MTINVFLTGATGFIGGEILYTAHNAHPEWAWTCLVRSKDKGVKVIAQYPNVRLVYGDTDNVSLIEKESSIADIVIHTAGSDDHAPSAEAIVRGLKARKSSSVGYYIHTSGFFSLAGETLATGRYGDHFDKVYDDWDKIDELTSLLDSAPHRPVDKIVLSANSKIVRTAIVSPSVVYGQGRGPDKTTFPAFFETFLKERRVFAVGKGLNVWHNVHVQDLGQIYLLLAEAAAIGGGNASWNHQGYYLAENGKYVQLEMLQLTAEIAYEKGLLPFSNVEFLSVKENEKLSSWLKIMLGANSQGVAIRARKILGWRPQMPTFEEEIGNALDIIARDHGLR